MEDLLLVLVILYYIVILFRYLMQLYVSDKELYLDFIPFRRWVITIINFFEM